jgi:pimeloyl-ACP methyl ester carboxylesterase
MTHRQVQTNGISMHIAEAGQGRPVILCHGFPELSYSWRRVMPALAGAGYHVVAPDQRGYGKTEAPERVTDYDMDHLLGDLLGLLDELGEERAVFIAHDWGAIVAWQLALMHPERVEGLVAISVPFAARGEISTISLLRLLAEDKFMYMLYFQEVGPPEAELERDPADTIRRIMWSISGDAPEGSGPPAFGGGPGFLDGRENPETLPDWLTQEDVDHFAVEFGRSGFRGPLNWYRNMERNWELSAGAPTQVTVPTLFITGDRDPVRGLLPESGMDGLVTDLRGTVILQGAGHWEDQERPDEVLAAVLPFLEGLPPH